MQYLTTNNFYYSESMIDSTQQAWREYLMEAAGIGGFVTLAGSLTVLLEHPALSVMRGALLGGAGNAVWRRLILGLVLGLYVAGVAYLFGKRSGAHFNPALTWTFYRLGKINLPHALFYTLAQFLGAICASFTLKLILGDWFAYPVIDYGVSKPQPPHGAIGAFVAEFIISFLLVLVVLIFSSCQKLERYTAVMIGILIALYLIFELPFSGMSLNPARSTAAALAADEWTHLWIYFAAPFPAMLLAAEIFTRLKPAFTNILDQEIPVYPKQN